MAAFGKEKQYRIRVADCWRFGVHLDGFNSYQLRLGRLRLHFPRPRSIEWDDLLYAISLRDFEPQSWRDYVFIPWWLARWFLAWLLTLARTPLLNFNYWLKGYCFPVFKVTRYVLPLHSGRHDDTNPIICLRCMWAGPRRWAVHTYASVDIEDVAAVDECPRCGMEI